MADDMALELDVRHQLGISFLLPGSASYLQCFSLIPPFL